MSHFVECQTEVNVSEKNNMRLERYVLVPELKVYRTYATRVRVFSRFDNGEISDRKKKSSSSVISHSRHIILSPKTRIACFRRKKTAE